MSRTNVLARFARFGLLASIAIVPACGGGTAAGTGTPGTVLWNSTAATGAQNGSGGGLLWNDPNSAVPGPVGIIGIGGTEITFGDADPTTYPPGTAEAPHPVSTSRSLDPNAEAVINSMVQQLMSNNTVLDPFGQPITTGPQLFTGDTSLAAVSRARCKHEALHSGTPPDPGLATRLTYAGINPLAMNPQQFEASGPGMTPTEAANQIAAAAGPYVLGLTLTGYGAAGYWTGGINNYYCFTIIELGAGQAP